jgi:ribosome-associated translation inhibitor RaiA
MKLELALSEIQTIESEQKELTPEIKALLRKKISEIESFVASQDQIEIPLKHYFSKGVYAREITIPAGSIIVGKIHKHTNLNMLIKGEITIISVDGAKRMKAPCTIVSSPGVKRLAYAHEETVWTTIHGTDETDLEKIEEAFIAKDYSEVVGISAQDLKLLEGV